MSTCSLERKRIACDRETIAAAKEFNCNYREIDSSSQLGENEEEETDEVDESEDPTRSAAAVAALTLAV